MEKEFILGEQFVPEAPAFAALMLAEANRMWSSAGWNAETRRGGVIVESKPVDGPFEGAGILVMRSAGVVMAKPQAVFDFLISPKGFAVFDPKKAYFWLKTSNFCQKHSSNAVPLKLLQDPTHAIEHTLTVDFDGRLASYDWNEVDELSLAYAISVHKSQGSEFPAVVLPLVPAHYLMLQRNLLYTAVTRARSLCVLVGSRKAISMAVGQGWKNNLTRLDITHTHS